MSGNICAVLNNLEEDGNLKPKKNPVNKGKASGATQNQPTIGPNGKPQLTAKAAKAFQQPKQQPKKKPQPAAAAPAAKAAPASSSSTAGAKKGAAPAKAQQGPAMVVKPAAPVVQVLPPSHLRDFIIHSTYVALPH